MAMLVITRGYINVGIYHDDMFCDDDAVDIIWWLYVVMIYI
jgi:hypothetical protein